jgi:hypothetical protein
MMPTVMSKDVSTPAPYSDCLGATGRLWRRGAIRASG